MATVPLDNKRPRQTSIEEVGTKSKDTKQRYRFGIKIHNIPMTATNEQKLVNIFVLLGLLVDVYVVTADNVQIPLNAIHSAFIICCDRPIYRN